MSTCRCVGMMLVTFLILGESACFGSSRKHGAEEAEVIFRHVNVIPMDTERVIPDRIVVVRNGVIIQIAVDDGGAKITAHAQIIETHGGYLLPGLVDMHVHITAQDLSLFLRNGITTVRELNGTLEHLRWKKEIEQGTLVGPHLKVSSPLLTGVKQRYRHLLLLDASSTAATVKQLVSQGYDYLKVYEGLSPTVYDQIVAIARANGVPAVGHIPKDVGLDHVLEGGQKSIEHAEQIERAIGQSGNSVMEDLQEKAATKIVQAGVWVTPTLASQEALCHKDSVWYDKALARPEMQRVDASTMAWWKSLSTSHVDSTSLQCSSETATIFFRSQQRLVRLLNQKHALLLAGTDTPNPLMVPGFSLHEELRNLHDAGLTNFEVLRTATTNPAAFFGQTEHSGTVEIGKNGDLLLVRENPLVELDSLREPIGVMVGGKWLPGISDK